MMDRAIGASNLSISDVSIISSTHSDEDKSPYQEEWDSLFSGIGYLRRLKSSAMKGKLETSKFRSVCWKLFLRCLPENRQVWIETVKAQRQHYEEIIDKFNTNPRNVETLDVTVNNPLSQSQQNPWNQYFMDAELKLTIQQDVVRTFPEIEFFHTPNIQKMMSNILFSYAREFPHLSYKQGMHELLAPIIFVLHYDQQAYLQASETDSLNLEIHILLNQNYIEHDAFYMFCQLMESVESWYTVTDYFNPKYAKQMAAEPFSQINPGNLLIRKLTRIYEKFLKHHDITLFSYLEKCDITPQIYGIRWLRLLFGREFTIHDLLILWDAIFADSITFHLVDYIFVAMLISIRDLLLESDYSTSLSHLMRFPNVVDVHYIVDLALHLREPDRFKMPERKILNPLPLRTSKDNKHAENKGLSKNFYPGLAKAVKSQIISTKSTESRPKSLSISSVNVLQSNSTESSPTSTRIKSSSLSERNPNAPSSDPDDKANEEIIALKSQIFECKLKNDYCTGEITQHLEKLQESMVNQKLQHEDEMFIALAGIKRVRDILKGTVSFTEEVLGDNPFSYSFSSPGSSKASGDNFAVEKTRDKDVDILCSETSAVNLLEVSGEDSFQTAASETYSFTASNSVIETLNPSNATEEIVNLESSSVSLNFEADSQS